MTETNNKVIKELIKMIIDVVELELETLNFTRKYDFARYKRLYQNKIEDW